MIRSDIFTVGSTEPVVGQRYRCSVVVFQDGHAYVQACLTDAVLSVEPVQFENDVIEGMYEVHTADSKFIAFVD